MSNGLSVPTKKDIAKVVNVVPLIKGEPRKGIYTGVSFEEYNSLDAIRNSYLGRLKVVPALAKVKQEDTDTFILGRATHTFILEGEDVFKKEFVVLPEGLKRNTNIGKKAYADLMLSNLGKEPIKFKDYEKIMAMRSAVLAHPMALKLLNDGVSEQSVVWRDVETGLICKARPDRLPNGKGSIVDLKTTVNAEAEIFARNAIKYGYDRQAGMYIDGLNHNCGLKTNGKGKYDSFIFIAVEKEPPYRVETLCMEVSFIERGMRQYKKYLQLEVECRKEGKYPHYKNPGLTSLGLPSWVQD